MIDTQYQKYHFRTTFAFERIVSECGKDGNSPSFKASKYMVLFTRDCMNQFYVDISMSGIEIAISDHFEMLNMTPGGIVTKATFRYQTVNMRIPFQIPAEGMKDHYESGDKIYGFVYVIKHSGNNTVAA